MFDWISHPYRIFMYLDEAEPLQFDVERSLVGLGYEIEARRGNITHFSFTDEDRFRYTVYANGDSFVFEIGGGRKDLVRETLGILSRAPFREVLNDGGNKITLEDSYYPLTVEDRIVKGNPRWEHLFRVLLKLRRESSRAETISYRKIFEYCPSISSKSTIAIYCGQLNLQLESYGLYIRCLRNGVVFASLKTSQAV